MLIERDGTRPQISQSQKPVMNYLMDQKLVLASRSFSVQVLNSTLPFAHNLNRSVISATLVWNFLKLTQRMYQQCTRICERSILQTNRT